MSPQPRNRSSRSFEIIGNSDKSYNRESGELYSPRETRSLDVKSFIFLSSS